MQWIGEQRVLDFGDDHFLVLLFVLQPQRNSPRSFILQRVSHQHRHGCIDMGTVTENRIKGRPGKRGAKFFLRHIAKRVVIAVEEPTKFRMKRLISGGELTQDKGFEEPASVGKMPLYRTGLRTGLDHHVFGGQWGTKELAGLTDCLVACEQGGCGCSGNCGQGHGLSRLVKGWRTRNEDVMPDET